MPTEKEKMLAGELYDPLDKQLSEERLRARLLIKELNETSEDDVEKRNAILKKLIPDAGPGLWLQPPFYCDYGTNIRIGEKVFFNFNYHLGNVYREKTDYKTSIDYFQKALENKIAQLGEKHKDLARYYKSISDVYYLMKNKQQGDLYKTKSQGI